MKVKFVLALGLFLGVSNASAVYYVDEWQVHRLLSPTFEEIQDEIISGLITCYRGLPDEIINAALEKHFERIEYMCFLWD